MGLFSCPCDLEREGASLADALSEWQSKLFIRRRRNEGMVTHHNTASDQGCQASVNSLMGIDDA